MRHSAIRGFAGTAAKALVSAGLIAFALRGVDSKVVFEHLRAADPLAIAAAIVVVILIAVVQARRWVTVLARMEHALPYADALRLTLIGVFFNQTLPSTIGGDAYRVWGAYHHGIHAGNAIVSVLVDRMLAMVALVAMILAGTWWLFDFVREPAARAAVGLVIAGTAAGFAIVLALARFAGPLHRWRVTRMLVRVSLGARAVLASFAATAEVTLLTILCFTAISYVVYLLAAGMHIELGIGHALMLVPLVALITILPVSIAGWGLRESTMVVALGLVGVPPAQAFSLSVLNGLVAMASGVPGGLLWLAARKRQ